MWNLVGFRCREDACSSVVRLITCLALVWTGFFAASKFATFYAWANSSGQYEISQQEVMGEAEPAESAGQSEQKGSADQTDKSTTVSGSVSDSESEGSNTSADSKTESAESAVPSTSPSEQIGPWYAMEDQAIDDVLAKTDRTFFADQQRANPVLPVIYGLTLAGILATCLLILRAKRQRTELA